MMLPGFGSAIIWLSSPERCSWKVSRYTPLPSYACSMRITQHRYRPK
jgi:hypothetical protein